MLLFVADDFWDDPSDDAANQDTPLAKGTKSSNLLDVFPEQICQFSSVFFVRAIHDFKHFLLCSRCSIWCQRVKHILDLCPVQICCSPIQFDLCNDVSMKKEKLPFYLHTLLQTLHLVSEEHCACGTQIKHQSPKTSLISPSSGSFRRHSCPYVKTVVAFTLQRFSVDFFRRCRTRF